MWPPRRPILLLVVAAVGVHLFVLLGAYWRTGRVDGYAFASLDGREFYTTASNIAKHGVFSDSQSPPLRSDTWRTPGYPLFLAAVMAVFGGSPVMLVVMQHVLCVLNVLLLFRVAARSMNESRAMLVAVLFLVEPYHLYYSLWLLATTLFVTVLLLTWDIWCRALESSRWTWSALLGALAGLLVLVRPVAGLVPFAVAVGLAVALCRSRGPARDPGATHVTPERQGHDTGRASTLLWPAIPVFLVICALVVGSWMTRNRLVAGHFALSDQGGVVLAYFKATEVELWKQGRAADRYDETSLDPSKMELPHTVWDDIDTRLQNKLAHLPPDQRATLLWRNLAQGNQSKADSFVVSRALSEIGWSYLTASPLSTAACCLIRYGSLLTFPLNLALKPPTGYETGRVTSFLKGSVYLLLCIAVLVRIARGGLSFAQVYFPLACTFALLLATTPQLDPRFRVPMLPFLLFIALLPRSAT